MSQIEDETEVDPPTSAFGGTSVPPTRGADLLGGLRAAVALLTRIPVGAAPLTEGDHRYAPLFFPLVGAAIGLAAGAVYAIFDHAGALPAAILAVLASLALTGAMHEDGLADSADALGGARDRAHLFDILKDSRAGTYGVAAIVLSIGLRASLLASLEGRAFVGLVLAHSLARLAPVALMHALPYVTAPDRQKHGAYERPSRRLALASGGVGLVVLAILLALRGLGFVDALALLLAGALVTFVLGHYFRARAEGYTGDFLGAAEQAAECAILLAFALTTA
jgi:adenosylcobinamide-GDP ribazoletransferase